MTSGTDVWKGYLLAWDETYTLIQSPFISHGSRVFGADSDHTTLAIAALQHRLSYDHSVDCVSLAEGVNGSIFTMATGVAMADEETYDSCKWDLLIGDDATVVLVQRDTSIELPVLDTQIEVDLEFHTAIEKAWESELLAGHVSQGAYVSSAQYNEGGVARMALSGQQFGELLVWPPRQLSKDGDREDGRISLKPLGSVASWTKLSAAGAPSEFSLRAPLLGGLTTVFLDLDDGPKGVFLMVDDEENEVAIGETVELVVRRIYAQEGMIRYGLRGRII
ncbi:hypothetical protein OAO46_00785 [Candidatus Poseidonia alphae]|nr:hypothetical protein [Candidatus Poseidonia alphae]MDA8748737.1 hypothetical protein [Candidatus Poseidonia alphae]MDA8839388.1 hypothetical protein [Candidatus Poseidonia alphae]MDC0625837.1 hypothetical protein [Candidatus Poseidonia alphae]